MQEGQPPEDEHNPWAHIMVMWGNLLYEASQMYAAGGREDWKESLDAAVDKFRAAGCPENDIQAALRNHTEAGQLDLPPAKASPSWFWTFGSCSRWFQLLSLSLEVLFVPRLKRKKAIE